MQILTKLNISYQLFMVHGSVQFDLNSFRNYKAEPNKKNLVFKKFKIKPIKMFYEMKPSQTFQSFIWVFNFSYTPSH